MGPADFYANVWAPLCKRFRREDDDAAEAGDYLEYLSVRLTDAEIVAAGRALWATREFFPRPADFISAAHAGTLRRLRAAVRSHRADFMGGLWIEEAGGVGSVGQHVVAELGGIVEVARLLERGPDVFRREVEAALSERVVEDATLAAPQEAARIAPGEGQRALVPASESAPHEAMRESVQCAIVQDHGNGARFMFDQFCESNRVPVASRNALWRVVRDAVVYHDAPAERVRKGPPIDPPF